MSADESGGIGKKILAGAVSGVIGTTAIYPVDLVKTRLQNTRRPTPLREWPKLVQGIWRAKGFRGFYSGLSANLVGVTPEKAIKLTVNDLLRQRLARSLGLGHSRELPWQYGMLAGGGAGLCQVVATTPMEMVKIQLQMSPAARASPMGVVRRLGVRGIYRGLGATLVRDIPFSLVIFPSHAYFKNLFGRDDSLAAGLLAGTLGALVATPMDVVKTRLQTSHARALGMLQICRDIYQAEGPKAFLKGSLQRCVIIAPLFGISLKAYELLK